MPKDQATIRSQPSFAGFETPTSNFFRMPTGWTDITAGINNLAELKVVEYILRHTWGFQEYGVKKHITVDEFVQGRKRQNSSRLDRGTGLSERAVRYGINRALASNLIVEEVDATDPGRIRKSYALRMREDTDPIDKDAPHQEGVHDVHPVHDLPPSGADFAPRSEKETRERNLVYRNSKAHAVKRDSEQGAPPEDSSRTNPSYQNATQSVQLHRTPSSTPRQPNRFVSITQALERSRPELVSAAVGPPPRPTELIRSSSASPELAACISEIAREFGDTSHLRANLTQATNLLSICRLPDAVFVARLYEARAITKDRLLTRGGEALSVSKPMAYFWSVVRDLLQVSSVTPETESDREASVIPGEQGRGEQRPNGRFKGQ